MNLIEQWIADNAQVVICSLLVGTFLLYVWRFLWHEHKQSQNKVEDW